MNITTAFLAVLALLLVGVGAWFITRPIDKPNSLPATVLSFEECVAAEYPITGTSPRQCTTPDGRTYAEEPVAAEATYRNATSDNIVIELPFPGAVTGKDFGVIGKARGPWFFEASFPVELQDANGTVIATAIATAEGNWMTTDFVPFKTTMHVPASFTGEAVLVLKKDNPSGLTENDASVSFPITVEY